MTFDQGDFKYHTKPHLSSVANENGVSSPVIELTLSLSLHHCLLVPSLSNNLLHVEQVMEQLNYLVLMYPCFFII